MKTIIAFFVLCSIVVAQQPLQSRTSSSYETRLRNTTPQQRLNEEAYWQSIYRFQDRQEQEIRERNRAYLERQREQAALVENMRQLHILRQFPESELRTIHAGRQLMGKGWCDYWDAEKDWRLNRGSPEMVYGSYFQPRSNGYYYGR